VIVDFWATFLGARPADGQAAFLAVERTAGTLKKVFDGALLASIERGIFFQFGAIEFVTYGDNIGHGAPRRV
jgi:hypothetical protein